MTPANQRRSAIIFDLDDTLYLQADFKRSGFRVVARWLEEKHGVPTLQTLNVCNRIIRVHGPSHPQILNMMLKRLQLSQQLAPALVQLFRRHRPVIRTFSGVHRLLQTLRMQHHIGILTDGLPAVQKRKVYALRLGSCVDRILFSGDLGLSKPAEKLYAWFEEQFHLPGAQLTYIGDNPHKDFIGARRRGWTTIRVSTGEYAKVQATQDNDAQIRLNSVLDLMPCNASAANLSWGDNPS